MNVTDETNPPPPSLPPQEPIRRLTRSSDDKVLTGLSGGLGRYFGVDPVIFRIAFVVLSLAGGTGILLYLAGWLLIPEDGTGTTEAERLFRGHNPNIALLVLGVIGAAIVLDQLGDEGGDVPIALTLIAVGAAVLWSRRSKAGGIPPAGTPGPVAPPPPAASAGSPPPAPASATPTTDAPPADAGAGPSDATRSDGTTAMWPPPQAPPPATSAMWPPALPLPSRPPQPRSVLVPVTLSLTAILAGVMSLAGASLAATLAAAVLVLGIGMVVGAWRGRARALIPFGLMLVPALVAASVIDVPLRGGIGERSYRPISVQELRSPYRLAIGELTLDLSRLDLAGQTVPVVVTNGIGELRVIVPRDMQVTVNGHAGAGQLRLFGSSWDGTDVDERIVSPPGGGGPAGPASGGRLVLTAKVGLGEVEVRRAAA